MSLHLPKMSAIALTCPKHRMFSGDLNAVKGGCPWCLRLVEIQETWCKLRGLISKFMEDKRALGLNGSSVETTTVRVPTHGYSPSGERV